MTDRLLEQNLTEDEIIKGYKDWAYHMAYAWGGYDLGNEIEDLAQEALIGVWKALGKHDPAKGALASYLATGGKMQLREVLKDSRYTGAPKLYSGGLHVRKRTKPDIPVEDDLLGNLFKRVTEDCSEQVSTSQLVRQAMGKLSKEHQKYVFLRFWCDLPVGEIQDFMENNSRHAWVLIRKQLEEELESVLS